MVPWVFVPCLASFGSSRAGVQRAELSSIPPNFGLGLGSGTLLDIHGEIGRVSMSVILVPFPKAEAAKAAPMPT